MQRKKKYILAQPVTPRTPTGKDTKNDISPWVNITKTLLPRIQLTKANLFQQVPEESRQFKSKTKRILEPKPEKSKITRYIHKLRHTDINESVSLTMATIQNTKDANKNTRKQSKTIDTSKYEQPQLSKQYSRFLFAMESEVKINKAYSSHKRHPLEYARKRRIMEILNINKSGDNPEKEEKPNLKVAFQKFNSFIPSYPKKVLEGLRRSPSPISQR